MSPRIDLRRELLQALVAGPLAWQTPAQLASALMTDLDTTHDVLTELEAADEIAPWELPDALYVTLTPRAADRLGVRLVPIGRSERMRWCQWDEVEPALHVGGRAHESLSVLDLVADPDPGPEAAIEVDERAARTVRENSESDGLGWLDALPMPTILLGTGLTPWPGPGEGRERGASCPGCRSLRLSNASYCLVCDRWGLDHLLALAKRSERNPAAARPNPKRSTPNPTVEATGSDKAKRRAKRRKHWAIRDEREKTRSGGRAGRRAKSAGEP